MQDIAQSLFLLSERFRYYETATAKSNHSSYFSLSSSERLADGLLSWGHSTDLDARTLSFKDGDLEDAYRERYYNGAKKSVRTRSYFVAYE